MPQWGSHRGGGEKMIDRPNAFAPQDIALGTLEMLHNRMGWLVVAGIGPLEKVAGVVEITARKLETRGEHEAAAVVRAAFHGALDGEWKNMQALVDPEQTRGSA